MIDEHDLREALRRRADSLEPATVDPAPALRRARRRLARTVSVTSLAVAALAAAVVIGVGKISAPPPPTPVSPGPSLHPSARNGDITIGGAVRRNGREVSGTFDVDPSSGRISRVSSRLAKSSADRLLAWSPDGGTLAYLEKGQLWILNVSERRSKPITRCPEFSCSVAWSPDGSAIAVSAGRSIETFPVQGGSGTILTTVGPGMEGVRDPIWLPNGKIEFIADSFGGYPSVIYSIASDGSDRRDLGVPARTIPAPSLASAWSPDGSEIAYLLSVATGNNDAPNRIDVMVVDISTKSAPTRVLRGGTCYCLNFWPGIGWSPDERQLALVIPGPRGPLGLYVANADGSGLRLLFKVDDQKGMWVTNTPAWRPAP